MVQILKRPESTSDRFAKAFANLGEAASTLIPQELMDRKERNSLSQLAGEDLSQIRNPDMQRMILQAAMQRRSQAEQLSANSKAEQENYEKIKDAFGEKFADVWKASPTGARTALETAAVQQGLRKLPVGGLFGDESEKKETVEQPREKVLKTPSGEDFPLPQIELPPEMTPSDRVKYRGTLRKENSPLFEEGKNKIKGLKGEKDRLGILDSLSAKVPDGIGRAFINKEGNIRPLAQVLKLVPPEAERFVKTVNDFISTAKDIFGARVTNYDLQIFKQRLPSLMNSAEGRKQIIRQMEVFNEMESNYFSALDKVYKSYGLGNISQEEAEQIAQQMIEPKEKQLREELDKISESTQNSSEESTEGIVQMLDPSGNPLNVPPEEVERLLSLGATLAQ